MKLTTVSNYYGINPTLTVLHLKKDTYKRGERLEYLTSPCFLIVLILK